MFLLKTQRSNVSHSTGTPRSPSRFVCHNFSKVRSAVFEYSIWVASWLFRNSTRRAAGLMCLAGDTRADKVFCRLEEDVLSFSWSSAFLASSSTGTRQIVICQLAAQMTIDNDHTASTQEDFWKWLLSVLFCIFLKRLVSESKSMTIVQSFAKRCGLGYAGV